MCQICKELDLGRLTLKEALLAIGEVLTTSSSDKQIEHMTSLVDKLLEKDLSVTSKDAEMEENWWRETHEE